MSKTVTLFPTDPSKVVPDMQGKRIGEDGVKVAKPMHPYYTRRVMHGDLTPNPKAPQAYEPDPEPPAEPQDWDQED